jgi:hypothetical protein
MDLNQLCSRNLVNGDSNNFFTLTEANGGINHRLSAAVRSGLPFSMAHRMPIKSGREWRCNWGLGEARFDRHQTIPISIRMNY